MINGGTPEYRFAPPGPRDEPVVVAECAWCGRDIYAGDEVTETHEHGRIHGECEREFTDAWFIRVRGVIGADGAVE